jgi:5-methylcytosine-specific restriction protein A
VPYAPSTPCRYPGCPRLVYPGDRGYCPEHRSEVARDRGSSTAQGYGVRWRKARREYLAAHPLCAECERGGRVEAATVVDHIVPHRGDYELFWNERNWQSLCATHHQIKTNKERSQIVW